MKINKTRLCIGLIVVVFALFNVYQAKQGSYKVLLSLSDLEQEAFADPEIDYKVPGKNNNPKSCSIYIEVAAGGTVAEGAVHVGGNKYRIDGMENFCEYPPKGEKATGCDPYNCHRRV